MKFKWNLFNLLLRKAILQPSPRWIFPIHSYGAHPAHMSVPHPAEPLFFISLHFSCNSVRFFLLEEAKTTPCIPTAEIFLTSD